MKNLSIRLMKMAFLYAFLGLLIQAFIVNVVFAITPANAQNLNEVMVNINVKNTSLNRVFNQIEEQTDYRFSYIGKEIPLNTATTIDANNTSLEEVLNELASQHNLTFKIIKNQIVVKPKIKAVKEKESKGKIKGKVVDANSGEALIGANIMVDGTSIGTAADINGKFVLPPLKPGEYTLKITYVGYKEKDEKVTVVSNRATEVIVKLDWIAVKGKEVVVTAQAKGQLSAINDQLSANEIKNVVSKDRIRELPDNNAAESVGRLPGVSLLRSGGEGNKVVIRGMQPKYSKIMVDGVSLAPNGSNDRSVSMSSISSYSLEGIEVIKSPTANMDGDQMGGSVNFVMRTAPKGLNYEVVAQGGYNELRTSLSDYMFVGNVSDRFYDNKFGVFAQVSIDRKNMGSNAMSASYFMKSNDPDILNPLGINGVNLTNTFSIRDRYGATLTLDYLIPDGKIYFKNFVSSGTSNTQRYNERYHGVGHSMSTTDATYEQLIYTNILSYEQYLSIFKVSAKLSHSYSGNDMPNSINFYFSKSPDINSYPDNIAPEEIPSYAENEYDKFLWTSLSDAQSETKGRQIMAKLDFETDFSLSSQINGKIKFGGKFRYDERSYDYEQYGGMPYVSSGSEIKDSLLNNIPQFSDLPPNTVFFYYPEFYDHNFSHGEFLGGRYNLGPVPDIEMMHNIVDIMRNARSTYINGGALQESDTYLYYHKSSVINDYSGLERLYAGYLMAEIDITKQIKFIPGVRYEANNTEYSGVKGYTYSLPEFGYLHSDTTTSRQNDFWLPMIHLRYQPLSWLQVRLAYTHTIARPSYRRILPNMDISTESITMNNPFLRPEQSENYDVYFAFSENHLGLFTVGGFWKNIDDKIFSQGKRILTNPEDYDLPPEYKGIYYYTYENNNKTAIVKGFELDWQTNFWYLPSFLKGFVLNVNYTKIYSEAWYPRTVIKRIKNPNPPPRKLSINVDESYKDRLQNQPDDILNLGIGYDYKGFSTRLSMNYSSDIFVSSSFWPEQRVLTDDYLRWDLSLTQKLPWYGLQLFFNVSNLTGTEEKSHFYGGSKPRSMNDYGTAIYAGIRLRAN